MATRNQYQRYFVVHPRIQALALVAFATILVLADVDRVTDAERRLSFAAWRDGAVAGLGIGVGLLAIGGATWLMLRKLHYDGKVFEYLALAIGLGFFVASHRSSAPTIPSPAAQHSRF